MDFSERVIAHAKRVEDLRQFSNSEETTKTSLIMPFFALLGYDPMDPRVVIPEYTADVGTKKGERVDYAIKRGDEIIMLVEAKIEGDPLDEGKAAQLRRYFNATPSVKIAMLTNGVQYKFFTDLEKPNIMDEKPYMVFDFSGYEAALIDELKKLRCDSFDLQAALCAAKELKYLRQIKTIITNELKNPSDDFVKFFLRLVVDGGRAVPAVVEEFRGHVRKAFQHHINDILNARLQCAIQPNAYTDEGETEATETPEERPKDKIITTVEELEGYHIIKAILRQHIDPTRITMRDTQSYFGILLDNNNRKPICRLHLNAASAKYIETFVPEKKDNSFKAEGTRHKIESLNDIYAFSDQLKAAIAVYVKEE